jgi:hypothetical protein
MINFTNYNGSNPTQPGSQDRITPSVWITRGGSRGIYNAAVETTYTHSLSPIGTEWAFGELTNYASLIYADWEDWFGGAAHGGPPSTVGKDAVLHIIPEDVYLSVTFTSWNQTSGGFSYQRSTPSLVPEPSSTLTITAGLTILALRFRSRRFPKPQPAAAAANAHTHPEPSPLPALP